MEDRWQQLLTVLKEEKDLYHKLVEIAREKQTHIINNDLEGLVEAVEGEETLLADIETQEKERQELLVDLEAEKSFNGVCKEAPPEIAGELRDLKKELLLVLEELWEINTTNGRLISDSFQLNNATLQSLSRLQSSRTYNPGQSDQEGQHTLFDKKA